MDHLILIKLLKEDSLIIKISNKDCLVHLILIRFLKEDCLEHLILIKYLKDYFKINKEHYLELKIQIHKEWKNNKDYLHKQDCLQRLIKIKADYLVIILIIYKHQYS